MNGSAGRDRCLYGALIGIAGGLALASPAPAQEGRTHGIDDARANLRLEVLSECREGVLSFQVVNKGAEWPDAGNIAVYPVGEQRAVTQRRFKLSSGQKATFRIRDAGDKEYGLWVEPSWTARPFAYDVKASCGR